MATLGRWCRWLWRWVVDCLTEDHTKDWIGETVLPFLSIAQPSWPIAAAAGVTACTVVVREGFMLPPLRQ